MVKKRSLFLKRTARLFSKDGSLHTHCYRCRIVQGELGKKRKLQQISGEKEKGLKETEKHRKLKRAVNWSDWTVISAGPSQRREVETSKQK